MIKKAITIVNNNIKRCFYISIKHKAPLCILFFSYVSYAFGGNIEVTNAGIEGSTTKTLLNRIDTDVINQSPDIVLLLIGTNDMVNSKSFASYSEYKSNLSKLILKLKANNIDIVLISPIPVDTAYLFTRHERNIYTELPNDRIKKARDIIKELSHDYNLSFIDLFTFFCKLGIPNHNKDIFITNMKNNGSADGVHPTAKGYELMSKIIFHKIIEYDKIQKGMKVICFGDSITKGIPIVKAGEKKANTYPACLRHLLNEYFNNSD